MIHGPDLSQMKERAKSLVMHDFVYRAERADDTPPTMRAKYVQKLAEAAEFVRTGVAPSLLTREADERGVPVAELAGLIVQMATPSDDMEIERVKLNLAIDAATTHSAITEILLGIGVSYSSPSSI